MRVCERERETDPLNIINTRTAMSTKKSAFEDEDQRGDSVRNFSRPFPDRECDLTLLPFPINYLERELIYCTLLLLLVLDYCLEQQSSFSKE